MGKLLERKAQYEKDLNALNGKRKTIQKEISTAKGTITANEKTIVDEKKPVFYHNKKALAFFFVELLLVFVLTLYSVSKGAVPKTLAGVLNFLFIIDIDSMYFSSANFMRAFISFVFVIHTLKNLLDVIFDKVKFYDKKWRFCTYIVLDLVVICRSYSILNKLALPIFGEKVTTLNQLQVIFVADGSSYINMASILVVIFIEIILLCIHICKLIKTLKRMAANKSAAERLESKNDELRKHIDDLNGSLPGIDEEEKELQEIYEQDMAKITEMGEKYYKDAILQGKIDEDLMKKAAEYDQPDACLYKGANMIKDIYAYDKDELQKHFRKLDKLFLISANAGHERGKFYHILTKSICNVQNLEAWKEDLNVLKALKTSGKLEQTELNLIDFVIESISSAISLHNSKKDVNICADLTYIGKKQYEDAIAKAPVDEKLVNKAVSYEYPNACLWLGKKAIEDVNSMTDKEKVGAFKTAKDLFGKAIKKESPECKIYYIYTSYYSINAKPNSARFNELRDISEWKQNLKELRELKKSGKLAGEEYSFIDNLISDIVEAINEWEEKEEERKRERERERAAAKAAQEERERREREARMPATITLDATGAHYANSFRVYVDGKMTCSFNGGQSRNITVSPGQHSIQAQVYNDASESAYTLDPMVQYFEGNRDYTVRYW